MAFTERYVTTAATGLGTGSSEADAWTLSQAWNNCAAGDRINIKAGVYILTSALYGSKSGTVSAPLAWRGYKTTIGDRDNETTRQVAGTDIPKIVTNSYSGYFGSTGSHNQISRIAFETNTSNRPALYYRTSDSRIFHCQFLSTAGSVPVTIGYGYRQILAFCEIEWTHSSVSGTAVGSGTHCQIHGNTIKVASPSANCISVNGIYSSVYGNLCINGATGCVIGSSSQNRFVCNNTFVGQTTGITMTGGNAMIINNLFSNCTTGVDATTACEGLLFSNAFHNVSTEYGANVNPSTGVFNSITETSDPFVDSANNDYTLKSDALSVGSAAPMETRTFFTQNNADIGAISSEKVSASSGSSSSPSTGTQVYPFRHLVEGDFKGDPDMVPHPLYAN